MQGVFNGLHGTDTQAETVEVPDISWPGWTAVADKLKIPQPRSGALLVVLRRTVITFLKIVQSSAEGRPDLGLLERQEECVESLVEIILASQVRQESAHGT